MKPNKSLNEIIELNQLLEDLVEIEHCFYDFAERITDISLRKLSYSTVVALGKIVESNSAFLMQYVQKVYEKSVDEEEFNKLMAQLEDKKDGKK